MAQVKWVTGNKVLRILKAKGNLSKTSQTSFIYFLGLAPALPEDLYHLIKKAVAIRKHMEKHRKVSAAIKATPFIIKLQDKDSKFRLILIESRIHRLARYYKTKSVLPPNWK